MSQTKSKLDGVMLEYTLLMILRVNDVIMHYADDTHRYKVWLEGDTVEANISL